MHLRLISLLGLFAFLPVAWSMSLHRKRFPWRTVGWGLMLQFAFALLILKTTPGRAVFVFAGAAIRKLVDFANEGARFVFGPLADAQAMSESFGWKNGLVLAILITGTIIMVAMLSSLFYR